MVNSQKVGGLVANTLTIGIDVISSAPGASVGDVILYADTGKTIKIGNIFKELRATWNAKDEMDLEDSVTIKLSRPLEKHERLVFLCNYFDVNNNAYSISWKMSDSHKKYIKQIDETTYTFKIEEAIKTCMSDGEFAEGGRTCSKHINYWN